MRRHRKPSPSHRWRGQHQGKRLHPDLTSAQAHADQLNADRPRPGERQEVYSCRWGKHHSAGEIAPEHWHVGRVFTTRRELDKHDRVSEQSEASEGAK